MPAVNTPPLPASASVSSSTTAIVTSTPSVVTRAAALVQGSLLATPSPTVPMTEASFQRLVDESAEALSESVRSSLTPFLTQLARQQVQITISPSLRSDSAAQRRLNTAQDFDSVISSVTPVPDSAAALPPEIASLWFYISEDSTQPTTEISTSGNTGHGLYIDFNLGSNCSINSTIGPSHCINY
ncbi:hypothetical protein PHYBOEH_012115 [Phytophthora boehmeriae]|uniref:Uncharacterized protein n=1 Tax=Phytophthora boehmeriae TaxID=109152 RepID=A0A8T1VD01_9STRA|nr:hypothetical protein PHYBOEH_012115 [Phytophthora boehmeriae]